MIILFKTLYGILNTNEKLIRNTSAHNSNITTANDKFNLIILSSNQSRFELLPLPSQQQTQQSLQQQSNSQLNKNQSTNLVTINYKLYLFL